METIDIYQRIYTSDITESSGIPALLPTEPPNEADGYVVVSEKSATTAEDLFPKVHIPAHKQKSYDLASALFDNYDLLNNIPDVITPNESEEVEHLLQFVLRTPPMKLARQYVTSKTSRTFSDEGWYAYVREMWFRPFSIEDSPTHSGFEHVFIGESYSDSKLGGLHWWYYFYTKSSSIEHKGAAYGSAKQGVLVPEVVTLTYELGISGRRMVKPIGGLFVGLSVEGIMAMALVRATLDGEGPNITCIEGAEVELRLYRSPDSRSLVTFYPIFKRVLAAAAPPTVEDSVETGTELVNSGIRLISALPNPKGSDVGREIVSLINLGETTNLMGWKVVGPNGSALVFGDVSMERGVARSFPIPSKGSLQLGNSGGLIKVLNGTGGLVQEVKYGKDVSKVQGAVGVWNLAGDLVDPMT